MTYKSIVLSGPIASGTTTAGQKIAAVLHFKFISAGQFFREYAKKHKIPLWDKEQVPDKVDMNLDAKLTQLAKNGQNLVIDSHYAGYFTRNFKHVFKVQITADLKERLKRSKARDAKETEAEVKKREKGIDKKFRKLYLDDNYLNPKFFDLVIDNTNLLPEEVVKKIITKFQD